MMKTKPDSAGAEGSDYQHLRLASHRRQFDLSELRRAGLDLSIWGAQLIVPSEMQPMRCQRCSECSCASSTGHFVWE